MSKHLLFALFGFSLSSQRAFASTTHEYGSPLPNSCVGLEDGDHWIQLGIGDQAYAPVLLTCNNEYIIIDVLKDPDLISYFSSFELWHYKLAGPANHDPVSWQEWFLPDNQAEGYESEYLISPDCSICDDEDIMQVHETDTTYWMTGNLAKLHWPVIGFNECDMDWDTYQCYNCESCMYITSGCAPVAYESNTTDYSFAGICGVTVQESNHEVYKTREIAQSQRKIKNYKPSIGTASEFCVCYKPDSELQTEYYLTDDQENLIEKKLNEKSFFNADGDISFPNPKYRLRESIYNFHHSPVRKNGDSNNNNNNNGEETFSRKDSENSENNENIENNDDGMELELDELANDQKNGVPDESDPKTESRSNPKVPQEFNNFENNIEEKVYYLSQEDFNSGPYRITRSGTYIIIEDIVFNFNPDDDYWPREDQADVYPGAASYRDPYHLGFFAGITIECDNVLIDLNSHKLEMSIEFYYQQRWFAIIELGSQQFLPGQGPAFFGPDPVVVNNIEIRNGILGRTSHFAIHGNFPTSIKFEDLKIEGFVTHGLQLNGWENLEMNNIDVGPSSEIEYLKGDYGHARILAQRLERIEDELLGTDESEYTKGDLEENLQRLGEVREELSKQMSLAYNYALNRVRGKFEDTDYVNPDDLTTEEDIERWTNAKAQFIHESGYPSASSVTGIFLNFEGASVFSYTMYTTHQSSHGRLSNIHIHDISHDMEESMRFGYSGSSGQMYPTPWNSDIPVEYAIGGKDNLLALHDTISDYSSNRTEDFEALEILENNHGYHGTIMTDVYFTMASVSDDWDQLGFLQIEETNQNITDVIDWVNGDTPESMLTWRFGCNQDIMGHSGKGLLGMRIDGVDDLMLSNIRVTDLYEHTGLGSDACGDYVRFTPENNGGHFKQSSPMQHGFSGNDLQAISIIASTSVELKSDISISNLRNDYSQAFALSFWTGNDVVFDDNVFVKVNNIHSGILISEWEELSGQTLNYQSLPNRSPEACAVRLEESQETDYYKSYIKFNSDSASDNILVCDVQGDQMCLGRGTAWTMYGTYESGHVCDQINSYDEWVAYNAKSNTDETSEEEAESESEAEQASAEESDNNEDEEQDDAEEEAEAETAAEDVVDDNDDDDDDAIGHVSKNIDIVGIEHNPEDDSENDGDVLSEDIVINDSDELNEDDDDIQNDKEDEISDKTKGYRISGVIIFLIIAVSIGTMLSVHFVRTKCCVRNSNNTTSRGYSIIPNHAAISGDYGAVVVA